MRRRRLLEGEAVGAMFGAAVGSSMVLIDMRLLVGGGICKRCVAGDWTRGDACCPGEAEAILGDIFNSEAGADVGADPGAGEATAPRTASEEILKAEVSDSGSAGCRDAELAAAIFTLSSAFGCAADLGGRPRFFRGGCSGCVASNGETCSLEPCADGFGFGLSSRPWANAPSNAER